MRGLGPVCAAKTKEEYEENSDMDLVLEPMNDENGIVLRRSENGVPATNVPWLVKNHSPNGFDWGYGGSGPADLALNILEALLRRSGFDGSKSQVSWSGDTYFDAAFALHQEFKWYFVSGLPNEGGVISLSDVNTWISERIPEQFRLF